ncbi:MAG: hypothetical protein ACREXX_19060 [Gammaproteobacteria bacterium]
MAYTETKRCCREHAMEASEVHAGLRHQGSQSRSMPGRRVTETPAEPPLR